MDVLLIVGLLLLSLCGLSSQFPQGLQTPNADTIANQSTSNPSNDNSTVLCTTARNIPGSCVERQYCDFSTHAIDLSLYAQKTYKKTCVENQTCCPFSFQIVIKPNAKPSWEDKDNLSLDDDDDK